LVGKTGGLQTKAGEVAQSSTTRTGRLLTARTSLESQQKGEKPVAGFCHNLLLRSGLPRLRQDLVNLVSALQWLCTIVKRFVEHGRLKGVRCIG
jgi:hypothetical protein